MKRVALLLCLSSFAFAQDINLPHTLSNSSVADADQVMANFNALKDGVNSRVQISNPFANTVLGNGLTLITPGTPDTYSGKYNTALGLGALAKNTSGSTNTASGFAALLENTSGKENTASGYYALGFNQTGFGNTAFGLEALFANVSGGFNVAVGSYALHSNTTGSNNVAVGAQALNRTNGSSNTALGTLALNDDFGGSANTAIGFDANVTGTLSNATAIGAGSRVDTSDKIQLGNTSVTSVATSGKLTTGEVTYPNAHGTDGQVLGTTGSGELVWLNSSQIVASRTQELEEQVASLQEQLQSQQEELLAIVQSQQEQIAQLQRMVEYQFAAR